MRVIIFSIILILLMSGMALADSSISIKVIDNEITPREEAFFDLEVTNDALERQRYSIYALEDGMDWNVDPTPLKDKIFALGPGSTKTIRMVARPLGILPPKIYYLKFSIESDLGEKYEKQLKVYLATDQPRDYIPTLTADIDMDEKIDPTKPVSIKLFLENHNPLNLTDLNIKIQSDIPEFNKEVTVDLPPVEEKTIEFAIIPNEYQQPKDYTLFFVFSRNGEVVRIKEQKIEIVSLIPEFSKEIVEEGVALKAFTQMTVTNEGNVRNTQKVKIPVSVWQALFTSEVNSEVIDGQRYLVWQLELGPDESITLNYVTNYRWLVYFLVFLLLLIGFYLYVQSPIKVIKSATTTKTESETLSEIKVTLDVKNLSRKALKDVIITDIVPGIANVQGGLELGTLKPHEIRHGKKITKVIWRLAELDVHEHRLITYKIKAKLNIVGTFSLPRATVTFKKRGKKKGKAFSNVFRIST